MADYPSFQAGISIVADGNTFAAFDQIDQRASNSFQGLERRAATAGAAISAALNASPKSGSDLRLGAIDAELAQLTRRAGELNKGFTTGKINTLSFEVAAADVTSSANRLEAEKARIVATLQSIEAAKLSLYAGSNAGRAYAFSGSTQVGLTNADGAARRASAAAAVRAAVDEEAAATARYAVAQREAVAAIDEFAAAETRRVSQAESIIAIVDKDATAQARYNRQLEQARALNASGHLSDTHLQTFQTTQSPEATAAASEAQRLAGAYEHLRATTEPTYAAQQRFNASLASARELYAGGIIGAEELAARELTLKRNLDLATEAAVHSTRANLGQAQEIEHVGRALVDSVAAGVNPLRALAFEAGRIGQVAAGPGGLSGAFSGISNLLGGPLVVGALAGTAAIAGIGYAMEKAGEAAAAFRSKMSLIGPAAGISGAGVHALAESLNESSHIGAGAAEKLVGALIDVGVRGKQPLADAGLFVSRLAVITGDTTEHIVQGFARAQDQTGTYAAEVHSKYGLLTSDQLAQIQQLDDLARKTGDLGDKQRAFNLLLGDLAGAIEGQAIPHLTQLGQAIQTIGEKYEKTKRSILRGLIAEDRSPNEEARDAAQANLAEAKKGRLVLVPAVLGVPIPIRAGAPDRNEVAAAQAAYDAAKRLTDADDVRAAAGRKRIEDDQETAGGIKLIGDTMESIAPKSEKAQAAVDRLHAAVQRVREEATRFGYDDPLAYLQSKKVGVQGTRLTDNSKTYTPVEAYLKNPAKADQELRNQFDPPKKPKKDPAEKDAERTAAAKLKEDTRDLEQALSSLTNSYLPLQKAEDNHRVTLRELDRASTFLAASHGHLTTAMRDAIAAGYHPLTQAQLDAARAAEKLEYANNLVGPAIQAIEDKLNPGAKAARDYAKALNEIDLRKAGGAFGDPNSAEAQARATADAGQALKDFTEEADKGLSYTADRWDKVTVATKRYQEELARIADNASKGAYGAPGSDQSQIGVRDREYAAYSREQDEIAKATKEKVGGALKDAASEFKTAGTAAAQAIAEAISGGVGGAAGKVFGALKGFKSGDFTSVGGPLGGFATLFAGSKLGEKVDTSRAALGTYAGDSNLSYANTLKTGGVVSPDVGFSQNLILGVQSAFDPLKKVIGDLGRTFEGLFSDKNGTFGQTLGKVLGDAGIGAGIAGLTGGNKATGALGGAIGGALENR